MGVIGKKLRYADMVEKVISAVEKASPDTNCIEETYMVKIDGSNTSRQVKLPVENGNVPSNILKCIHEKTGYHCSAVGRSLYLEEAAN